LKNLLRKISREKKKPAPSNIQEETSLGALQAKTQYNQKKIKKSINLNLS